MRKKRKKWVAAREVDIVTNRNLKFVQVTEQDEKIVSEIEEMMDELTVRKNEVTILYDEDVSDEVIRCRLSTSTLWLIFVQSESAVEKNVEEKEDAEEVSVVDRQMSTFSGMSTQIKFVQLAEDSDEESGEVKIFFISRFSSRKISKFKNWEF